MRVRGAHTIYSNQARRVTYNGRVGHFQQQQPHEVSWKICKPMEILL